MKKNILLGLAVGAAAVILLAVLYLFFTKSQQPAPITVTSPAPPPAVVPNNSIHPLKEPSPKEAAPKEVPAVPPAEQAAPAIKAPVVEPGPPAPKVEVPPPEKKKEQYGVLVGSYRQYRDAGKMLARLKKQGKPGFIKRSGKKPHQYQVWAGPFSSRTEAGKAQKSLRAPLKRTTEIRKLQIPIAK